MHRKNIEIAMVAGGRGKRMGELTKDIPKPMLDVEGQPILIHILDNIIDAFGSAKIVMATGYKGDYIEKQLGSKYQNIDLSYVRDNNPLEIKKRLLTLEKEISSSFLFLATDVICDSEGLLRVVELQEAEKNVVFGTVAGAENHTPSLTHALIKAEGSNIIDLEFPPPTNWNKNDLRDIHVACFQPNFFGMMKTSTDDINSISLVIKEAIKKGKGFQVSRYCKPWYHYASLEDLTKQIKFG